MISRASVLPGKNSKTQNRLASREYLERIRAAEYATSSTYVSTCMSAVERWDLEEWDDGLSGSGSANPFKAPSEVLRLQSRGMEVKWLQYELNARGFSVDIDGIFGPETEGAVKAFQEREGLDADGIVGARTRGRLLANP